MSRRTYLSTVLSTPMQDQCGCTRILFLECAADEALIVIHKKFMLKC